MSKAIVTVKPNVLDTYTGAQRKGITRAYAALAGLEPSAVRIRKAAQSVGTLRGTGYGLSIRAIVAVMSIEGNGTLPTSKGTIERLGYVADAIGGEWPDTGDSADAILMALYRIAQTGKASDVARAAEMGRKATDGDSAFAAVDAIRAELNKAEHKSLTTAPARKATPPAPDADADDSADAPAPVEKATTREGQEALSGASMLALIAELTRRVGSKAFTADDVLMTAFDSLASAWEERITTADALADA